MGPVLTMLLAGMAAPAAAQVVERHLPPVATAPAQPSETPVSAAETDDRPLGPPLAGIILLGDDSMAQPSAGIRLVNVTVSHERALVRGLDELLGRPLSRKLIADAVAVVTRHYRAVQRPFVSVVTPPQDVTEGVLKLRVVEFVAGRLATRASTTDAAARVAAGIRFAPGSTIDARRLRQDLDWLGHDPFRRNGAAFSPGGDPGTTDLTVNVTSQRPWQVFGGIAASDAPSSGDLRISGGFVAGDLPTAGSLLSVQATVSGLVDPRYWSTAARVTAPLGPRREVSLLIDHVRGRVTFAPFASRADTTDVALNLRFALPPALFGDARIGIEAGHQRVDASFAGLPFYRNGATTFALVAGYNATIPITAGILSGDIAVHVSPGAIGPGNTAQHLFFGRPRAGSATYAYLNAAVTVERALATVLTWRGAIVVQASLAPLPSLAQSALGGVGYVRGYTLDDGGFDSVAIARNAVGPRMWRIAPYLFADLGYGRDEARRRSITFGSAGIGISRAVGSHVRLLGEAALPLCDGPETSAFHPRIFARADFTF